MRMVLYGSPGSGKSTLGRHLASRHGFQFADGDDWLPADMVASLDNKLTFTDEQRDRFARVIVDEMRTLRPPCVVAQALLKRRQRDILKSAFPDLILVRAHASEEELTRRLRLGGNLVDEALGATMNAQLEIDPDDHVVSDSTQLDILIQKLIVV